MLREMVDRQRRDTKTLHNIAGSMGRSAPIIREIAAKIDPPSDPITPTALVGPALSLTAESLQDVSLAGADGVSDASFTASGNLCVNERTLYAPVDGGGYRRVIVLGEARVMDVWTIDPSSTTTK